MVTSYLAHLPRAFMRAVAGHSKEPGTYFLRRGVITPPESLLRIVWPWVDLALSAYQRKEISNPDLTGKQFLELLKALRVVFLQDSAILLPQFPGLSIWQHPVFDHPDWPEFAASVRNSEAQAEEPADVRVRNALPVLADNISAMHSRLASMVAHGTTHTATNLKDLRSLVRDLHSFTGNRFTDLEALMAAQKQSPHLMVVPSSAVKHDYMQEVLQNTLTSSSSLSLLSAPSSSQPGSSAVQTSTPPASLGLRPPNKSPSIDPVDCPPGCPPGCPPQPLATSMRSMKEVYREWYTGLEGGRKPSVIELDHRFGNRWRYSSVIRTRWSDRKTLINAVNEEATRRGISAERLVEELDALKDAHGYRVSPDKIKRLLRQHKPLASMFDMSNR